MEAEVEEEARIRTIKEKGLLRVRQHLEAERQKAMQQSVTGGGGGGPDSPSNQSGGSGSSGNKSKGMNKISPGARGSGLVAVRAARVNPPSNNNQGQGTSGVGDEVVVPPEVALMEKKERARDMRLAKEKQVELLKAMAEDSKKQKEKVIY